MTRVTATNHKSAASQIDRIIAESKRITADLISLRAEMRELPATVTLTRQFDVVHQRIFLLKEQGWALNDRLEQLSKDTRIPGVG